MIKSLHYITRSGGRHLNPNATINHLGRRFLRKVAHITIESPSDVQSTSFPNSIPNETLLHPGDWNCPQCNFFNFSRNIRCLCCEKLNEVKVREVVEEQRHLPLKKGDWNCSKCGFLNFAKNSKCLLCETGPFNRQIDRVEWICDSCNHLNSGRNAVCVRCYCKRAKSIRSFVASAEDDGKRTNKSVGGKNHNNVSSYGDGFEYNGGKRSSMEFYSEMNNIESLDFPIVGGKSEASRNSDNFEKWGEEMNRKNHCGDCEKAWQVKSDAGAIPEFLQNCSDDDEIEEWFV